MATNFTQSRRRANSGAGGLPNVASGYVSAVGELIPFPSTNGGASAETVTIGRGGLIVLLGLTVALAGFTYLSRKYQQ